jgi:hypothetical protein
MNGFITNEIYYSQQDIFIAALFNCENAPKDEISNQVSEIVLGQPLQTKTKLNDAILNSYLGVYSLKTDSKRTITILKDKSRLMAKISGQDEFEILFQTTTKFQLKGIGDATGEFIIENGKVTKMIVSQNGQFEWVKIK